MGIVKASFKTLVSDSSLSSREAGLESLIAGSEDGYASGCASDGHQKNGLGDLINGRGDFGIDELGSRVIRNFGTRDLDISGFVEGRFDDSEIRGASCLLKMRETGRESSSLRGCATENPRKLNSTDVSSIGGDGLVVEENDPCLDGSEVLDDRIVAINVPIAESSENKDNGEEEDLDEEGFEFSVGDFVWSKIKSHPWWPGQIYDPSDASKNALKLKQRERLLVAYFGDGTFSWCHPSQLKPFEENYEDMSRQSNFKSFHNAVQEAVDMIGRIIELKMICSCLPKEHCKELDRPLVFNAGIKEGVLLPEGGLLKISGFPSRPTEILDEMKGIACRISISNLLKLKMFESQLSAFYRFRAGHQLPSYYEPVLISGLEDSLDDEIMGTSKVNIQGPSEEDWLSSPLSQVISGNRQYQRRKQKSIAEIMDSDVGSMASVSNVSLKEGRKRKRKLIEPPFQSCIEDSVVEYGGRKSPSSSKKKNENDADSRETEVDGGQKEAELEEGKITSNVIQSDEEQTEKSYMARERKKSKYLSPPFTSLNKGKKKKDIEEESLKVSNGARVGERMAAAASNISRSSPILRLGTEMFQKQIPEDIGLEQKTLGSIGPQTPKQDESETMDLLKVKASIDELLSEVKLVALGPPYPRPTKSFEIIEDFMSMFRSSIFRNGCYYKVYNRCRPGRKRKLSNLEQGFLGKDLNQRVEPPSDEKKIRKRRKVKLDESELEQEAGSLGARSAKSKPKKFDEMTELKTNGTTTNEVKDSPVSLFVTFLPGSSLPSKADLLQIYGKFGTLNEVETEMFRPNFCARIAFLKNSDGEEAFNSSQKVNPFGDSTATFKLRTSSRQAVKTRGLSELPRPEASPPSAMESSVDESSQLQFIRTKLEKLNSMVENSVGKVSPDLKSKLQGEMKGLLDQVSTMVVKSTS